MTVGTVMGVEPALNAPRRVLRQSLKIMDEQILELPYIHRIVHVDMSRQYPSDRIDIWYEIEEGQTFPEDLIPAGRPCKYKFFIEGTGHKVEPATQYVGTAIDSRLRLVWHVYIGHSR